MSDVRRTDGAQILRDHEKRLKALERAPAPEPPPPVDLFSSVGISGMVPVAAASCERVHVDTLVWGYGSGISTHLGPSGYLAPLRTGLWLLDASFIFGGAGDGDHLRVGFEIDDGSGWVSAGAAQRAIYSTVYGGEVSISHVIPLSPGLHVNAYGCYLGALTTAYFFGKFSLTWLGT